MSLWQEKMFSLSSCQFTNPVGIFSSPPQTGERNKGFTGKKYFCNLAAHVSDVCPASTTYIFEPVSNKTVQSMRNSFHYELRALDDLAEIKAGKGQSIIVLEKNLIQ